MKTCFPTCCVLLGILACTVSSSRADPPKGLIIDVHMHVWSDDPVRFPFAHPYDLKFVPPKIPASLDLVVKEMDTHGINHCVLVQTISHGWDNRYLVHCLKAHPRRFRGQGLIDPTDPQVAKKLEYWMREHGLAGVRFSPMYYQGKDAWLNAKTSEPLWQKAEELGAVFNFFLASEQLPRVEDMVRKFPKVKVVIDHLARIDLEAKNPEPEIRKLLALARYPNVWVKVSELNILSPSKKYPYRDTYPLVKKVYDTFGPDRLLWGTGFPGATRGQADRPTLQEELALIQKEILFFTDEDRAKILGRNAAKVWGFAEPTPQGALPKAQGSYLITGVLASPHATQAAAADDRFIYAISDSRVVKYDRATGKELAQSSGEATHLNSGYLWQGKLYCAHSNYPRKPHQSDIRVLDPATMVLKVFHDFADPPGSLTWAVRRGESWWCHFAHYGKDNGKSVLVQYDDRWKEVGRWTYPAELVDDWGTYSLSGGLWQGDFLLATGHDKKLIYKLKLPKAGKVIDVVEVLRSPFPGQGIAADPKTGGLVGIDRSKRQAIFTRLE